MRIILKNSMGLFSLILISTPFLWANVRAEEINNYVIISCNQTEGFANIEAAAFSGNGQQLPKGGLLLSVLQKPTTVCILGKKHSISIRGNTNEEHPDNNNVEIYIDGEEFKKIFPNMFADGENMKIKSEQNGHLDIQECIAATECVNDSGFVNPSFDCANAKSSETDKEVCMQSTFVTAIKH